MKKKLLFGLLFVVVIFVSLIIANYNNIPRLDENVNEKWSQVQNQYKRRADLIPNLVATVKAYASHEKETFTNVVEARSKVSQINVNSDTLNNPEMLNKFNEAQSSLTSALSKLMLVVERYPELKADKNFLSLQAQLEGTENRITIARADFVKAIKAYNLELRTLPGSIVAAIVHPSAKIKENFKATQSEQNAPKVEF